MFLVNYVSCFDILWSMVFFVQCAASMDVRIGSFCDPDGLEGLAHFLGENKCLYSMQFFFCR